MPMEMPWKPSTLAAEGFVQDGRTGLLAFAHGVTIRTVVRKVKTDLPGGL